MDEIKNFRGVINNYLGLISKIGLILVILAAFFLFTNLTTEFYDTSKFLALIIFIGLVLILLTLRFTITGKVTFIRSPLDLPLLLLLAVAVVSTILTSSPYVSLLGNQLKIHGSLVSLIAYILFYFVLVNTLKNAKEIKWILTVTIIAAQVLSVITLLTYAGIKILPSPWTHGINFTPTGSSFSTTAVLALLLPFVIIQILGSAKISVKIINACFLTLMGLTIALTGSWATWIAAIFGLVMTLFISNLGRLSNLSHLAKTKPLILISLIAPIAIIALVTILSFAPPMGGAKNAIYAQAQNFPREIQLPFVESWKISVSAFRDTPFWGTGPSTYAFDFTNYKPVEFNSTKIWGIRFDSSFNEYLQTLATLGGIGLVALLSLTALFISSSYPVLANSFSGEQASSEQAGKRALAISGLSFFIILALHPGSLVVWVIGILILSSFMVANLPDGLQKSWNTTSGNLKNMFLRAVNISATASSETIKIDALPSILLAVAVALVLFTSFFGGKFALADYHHRLALNAVAQNQGIVAYNELVATEKLNPYNDLYRIDLAQTNFALANAIAAAKGPTEASPAGSLTDQDKQNIQVLIQQSINEARSATTLSPKSSVNWEVLALLYRQIAGVAQNALVFSLDSYGRAIFQDPLNPNLRVNVGGVYYAIKNYDMAIRFFTDSINLKPDFANGYYNLSVSLRDKGDLANAQAVAEKVLTLIDDKNSADYKTVSDYLADLKSKIAAGSATGGAPSEPPAAGTSGALQQKELPKVVSLPKPEKIATPEAIKKPEATPIPSPSPTQQP